MEKKEQCKSAQDAKARQLTEEESAQVAGGFQHGHLSSYKCKDCGLVLQDAGTYYEHRRMAHGK